MSDRKISFIKEVWGLTSPWSRLKETSIAIFGDNDVPRTKFGISSLSQMHPSLSIPLWLGRQYRNRTIVITNLFNHLQPPVEYGWSVRKTRIKDFRGKKLTYDSHHGTDLAVPIRTRVVAPASGIVVRIWNEYNRGGLKMFIDHGNGLITGMSHLSRAVVKVGDKVQKGQHIAYSGYSGIDGLLFFPLNVPHVHFHVWLNGIPCDPFSLDQTPLWEGGNQPKPIAKKGENQDIRNDYNIDKLNKLINSCKNESVRKMLANIPDISYRAPVAIIEKNFYPTRFTKTGNVYSDQHPRSQRLSLPFLAEDFDGFVFWDEIRNSSK